MGKGGVGNFGGLSSGEGGASQLWGSELGGTVGKGVLGNWEGSVGKGMPGNLGGLNSGGVQWGRGCHVILGV